MSGTSTMDIAEYGRVHWVERGGSRVELLRRGGRLALRVRAATSPSLPANYGRPRAPMPTTRLSHQAFVQPTRYEATTGFRRG